VLSPSHAIEAVGMAIFKHVVQTRYPHRFTRPADKQASTTDVYYAGQKVQAKATSKPRTVKGKYEFHLRHGHAGNTRPYATEDNRSLLLRGHDVQDELLPRAGGVRGEARQIVGEKAKTTISLPHPEKGPPTG